MARDPATEISVPVEEACYEINALSCWYRERQVLREISMRIPRHRVTALIGPGGAGKSALLSCLGRRWPANVGVRLAGEALLEGRSLYGGEPGALQGILTVLPEVTVLAGTIYHSLADVLRVRGVRRRREVDEEVERLLRTVGLWDAVKDRLVDRVERLAVGEQGSLRLALALAATPGPRVVLLDSSLLDFALASRSRIEELIDEWRASCTVVLATNDMQLASRVSDYVAFLYLGELIELGETERIFINPLKMQTEDFITGRFG